MYGRLIWFCVLRDIPFGGEGDVWLYDVGGSYFVYLSMKCSEAGSWFGFRSVFVHLRVYYF